MMNNIQPGDRVNLNTDKWADVDTEVTVVGVDYPRNRCIIEYNDGHTRTLSLEQVVPKSFLTEG